MNCDGNRSRMSFTFTDADYIKTYIILPLCHMWAKHIPVACNYWGYCPSNLWTWGGTSQSTCPVALLHEAIVGLYQQMWLHGIDINQKKKKEGVGREGQWNGKKLKASVVFRRWVLQWLQLVCLGRESAVHEGSKHNYKIKTSSTFVT